MVKRLLKLGSRTGLAGMEALAAAICLCLLLLGLLMWRLSTGPIDASFARNYIQEALHNPETDTDVVLEHVAVSWPKFTSPIQLTLKNVSLVRRDRRIVSVESVTVGLSTAHLLLGRIEPIVISLDRPVVGLVRTGDNRITLNIKDAKADAPPADSGENPLLDIIEALSRPKNEVKASHSPLAALKTLQIVDATVILEDHHAGMTMYLQHVNFEFGRDGKGLAITSGLKIAGGLNGRSSLRLDALYSRETGDIAFNLQVDDYDLSTGAWQFNELAFLRGQKIVVGGSISGVIDRSMTLRSMTLDLKGPSGLLAVKDVYAAPLPYQGLRITAAYDGAQKKARIDTLQLTVKGVTVKAGALIAFADTGLRADVRIAVPRLDQVQIGPLWPDSLKGDGAETWLVHKLSNGYASNIDARFSVLALHAPEKAGPPAPDAAKPQDEWQVSVDGVEASFDVSNMNVDYRAPLAPAKGAYGRGAYRNGNLDIDIAKGSIDDLAVGPSHVRLVNVAHAALGRAEIDVKAAGPLKTVFSYIEDEPIGMTRERLGFDSAQVRGDAALDIKIGFPTTKHLRADEVKVTVNGDLRNVILPRVVEGMDLSGGPFRLQVEDAAASLSGNGRLDGRDITLVWKQYLESAGKPWSSRVAASMRTDPALRARFGFDLPDWIGGNFPVDVVYTVMADHTATVDVKADLTPATLLVKPFDYAKQPGETGSLSCRVALDRGQVRGIGGLSVSTADLSIEGGQLLFGPREGKNGLTGGKLPQARLKDTKLALDFSVGSGGAMNVRAKGAFLDASPFLGDAKNDDGKKTALTAWVQVDRMRTRQDKTIDNVRLALDRSADGVLNRLELDAVAGKGAVKFRLKPDETGRMALQLDAGDAGAVLRAFDIYKNAVGGKLSVRGRSADAASRTVLSGKAEITDFRVINAPVLARLVNAMSLTGIPALLEGEGLAFSRLEGDFEWRLRPVGDLYIVKDGRTSGASLGLTFAGSVDKQKKWTDIDGTIVPVSGINGLVGNIPVLGTLLTGGGALFAFTYSIEGPSDTPSVSVNPLSALAPGIVRKIFFEGG